MIPRIGRIPTRLAPEMSLCHSLGWKMLVGFELMVYVLRIELSAEFIRLTETPNRLATDSGE
jgi:hypothetical protein